MAHPLRALLLVSCCLVGVVLCASPSGLSVLNQFSAFTCGNFVSFTADNQGSLAAGGNITLGDYEVGTNLPTNCARFDLSAGGAVKLFNTALNHGSLAYGTTYSNDRSTIACSTVKNPSILPYSQMCSALNSDSQQLGATKPNSPTVVNFSDLILNGVNVGNNIFSVTSAQLANARSIHISVPLDAWATINIAGTAPITFGNTNIVLSPSTVLEKVLFNFYQTSRLNMFAISVPGSLVAINADIQFDNGNIDGSIASLSFNGTGEIHLHPYVPPTCNCTVCPPQYQLPPWSIFALTNVNQTDTDDEGNFAIGGNAYLSNYAVGSALPQFGPPVDMVVGGDLHYSVGQVFRGSVLVGGIATINNLGIPDGQLYQKATIPINFLAAFQQLGKFSRSLSQITPTGSASFDGNVVTFSGSNASLNVFNAPANITSFNINAPANAWVVINFAGSSGTLANGNINLSGGVSYETIILNFFEAKLLTIQSISVSGGVLAPNAAVTFNNGNINGCFWVDSIEGTGETHYYPPPPFTPECPPCSC